MIAYVKNVVTASVNTSFIFNFILKILRSVPVFIILCLSICIVEMFLISIFSTIFGTTFSKYNVAHLLFFDLYTALCLLVLPLVLNKLIFKANTTDLGLRLPASRIKAVVYSVLVLLIILPVFYFVFMNNASFKTAYTFSGGGISIAYFMFLQFFILPVYYFCEEFFFRGIYFMYLWEKIGWHSFWITEVTFMFAHLGKPGIEILISFPAGILLNFLTIKTKSIYPAALVHTIIGITINALGFFAS
jgi:membrane protease YdiL (CAAX protease family)